MIASFGCSPRIGLLHPVSLLSGGLGALSFSLACRCLGPFAFFPETGLASRVWISKTRETNKISLLQHVASMFVNMGRVLPLLMDSCSSSRLQIDEPDARSITKYRLYSEQHAALCNVGLMLRPTYMRHMLHFPPLHREPGAFQHDICIPRILVV